MPRLSNRAEAELTGLTHCPDCGGKFGTWKRCPKGYDRWGWDVRNFNKDGIHRITKGEYNTCGYDARGFSRAGVHKDDHSYWESMDRRDPSEITLTLNEQRVLWGLPREDDFVPREYRLESNTRYLSYRKYKYTVLSLRRLNLLRMHVRDGRQRYYLTDMGNRVADYIAEERGVPRPSTQVSTTEPE